ncbi:MAG: S8 family serine peptidase [Gemmatimonadales bacterium]
MHYRRTIGRTRTIATGALLLVAACATEIDPPPTPDASPPSLSVARGDWLPTGMREWRDRPGAIPRFPEIPERLPSLRYELSPAPALSDADLSAGVRARSGSVVVGLKPAAAARSTSTGVTAEMTREQIIEARNAVEVAGLRITRTFASFPAVVGTIDPELAPRLREHESVDYVELEPQVAVDGIYAAGAFLSQTTDWGITKIDAPTVWPYTTGSGASITVIDTGIDSVHVYSGDGPSNLLANLRCLYDVSFSSCFADPSAAPFGIHGSHVSGIAAARDNSIGYVGVASGAKVNSIKICDASGCSGAGLLSALDWTTYDGGPRQIVNLSLSVSAHSTALSNAITAADNAGNVLIGSAGNNLSCGQVYQGPGVDCYPARYTAVISVSGTTAADSFATNQNCGGNPSATSNWGSGVDISAPFEATNMIQSGGYGSDCGTSMAAPHVSGVAALTWAYTTGLTKAQVKSRLTTYALDLGAGGRDDYFGHGRVRAIHSVFGPPGASISGPYYTTGGLDSWTASASPAIGTVTYAWERKHPCDVSYTPVGTNSATYSEYTTLGDKIQLRVSVTAANGWTLAGHMVGGFEIC